MANVRANQLPGGLFRVRPEHCPKTKQEKYRRLHFYVSRLGVSLSDYLMEVLLNLRRDAYQFSEPAIQQMALKAFDDQEYTFAVKEMLCIWLHLEAMDQGGDSMPDWLLGFLRLAFSATDILVGQPKALDVLKAYSHCTDEESLCRLACIKTANHLGFGLHAESFAPFLKGLLYQTGSLRQSILKESLTAPLESLSLEHPGG